MTELTELEQTADREARHGHRELVERLEAEKKELALQALASQGQADEALARVAELEAEREGAWNDAIRAAADICDQERYDTSLLTSLPPQSAAAIAARDRIRALLRNEGGDDE